MKSTKSSKNEKSVTAPNRKPTATGSKSNSGSNNSGGKVKTTAKSAAEVESEGKESENKERSKPRADTLPLVSVLHKSIMKDAIAMLQEAHMLKKRKAEDEARLKDLREQLGSIAIADDLPGLRYGALGIQVNGYIARKSFSQKKAKELMLEHGIPAEEIANCYEESDEYLDVKLIELAV